MDGLEGVRKEPVEAIRRSKGFGQIDGLGFFGNIEKTFVPLTCLLLGLRTLISPFNLPG